MKMTKDHTRTIYSARCGLFLLKNKNVQVKEIVMKMNIQLIEEESECLHFFDVNK